MSAETEPITVAHAKTAFAGQVVTDNRVSSRLRRTAGYLTARGFTSEQITAPLIAVAKEVSAQFDMKDQVEAERAISQGISDGLERIEAVAALELPEVGA